MAKNTRSKQRVLSVDALRGFDMIWILGAEGFFAAFFLLTGWSFFNALAEQFKHSSWHGLTFYDLIFPLFIFISGVTLGLANLKFQALSSIEKSALYRKATARLAWLILLGVVYNHGWGQGIPVANDEIRFASVLQRIGIAWFITAMLVWHCKLHTQIFIVALILLGYWILLSFIATPAGDVGVLTIDRSWNSWVDQHLLPGAHYRQLATDPEGLLSHLPAVVNGVAGAWTGRWLKQCANEPGKLLLGLLVACVASLLGGYLWSYIFPINKVLWTSSFALVTVGWSILLMGIFYALIDVLAWQKMGHFFALIGVNAILLYMLSSLFNWQYFISSLFGGVLNAVGPKLQPLLSVVILVLLQFLLAAFLKRQRIFIKI